MSDYIHKSDIDKEPDLSDYVKKSVSLIWIIIC